ncbi:MAG: type VII toxin-antitoxin system HepT family RNase toxin [Promethearchaeota archaeon]
MLINRIIAKFEKIHENIELITNNLPKDESDFSQLGLIKDGIYKRYEFSVELILDIAAMINSHHKFGIPNNTMDIINNLKQNSVISVKNCDILHGMRSFRNVLVHVYDKLDDVLAYNNILANLDDFPKIEEEIMQFIRKSKSDEE